MATAMTQVETLATRLTSAADTVEELEEQLRIARERRDGLIVEGYDDEAMKPPELARHARLSRARVLAIIALS